MSLELQDWRTLAWPQISSPIEPQQGLSVCSVLVMPPDHLPAHRLAADGSSETHSNQANSYRLWLRLESDVLGSVRVK